MEIVKNEESTVKQIDKFIITNKLLGQGGYGKVYLCFFAQDPTKLVAAKTIQLNQQQQQNPSQLKQLKREIDILQSLKHKNVIQFYQSSRTRNNLYLFFQYCNDGDFKEFIKSRGSKIVESEALTYIRQICEGYKCLYDNKIIHRDIKPSNIMLHDGRIVIGDLGYAQIYNSSNPDQLNSYTLVGSPMYMSPQIMMQQSYSSKCDIWSLGILFFEILYGVSPWKGSSQIQLLKNIEKLPLTFPQDDQNIIVSDNVKNLIMQMLTVDEQFRISWPELFAHPLINQQKDQIVQRIQSSQSEISDNVFRAVLGVEQYCSCFKILCRDKFGYTQQDKDQQNIINKIQQMNDDNSPSNYSQHQKQSIISKSDQGQTKQNSLDLSIFILQQEKLEKLRKQLTQLDEEIVFKRNVNIFVLSQSVNIFKMHQQEVIIIQDALLHCIIFVLLKYYFIENKKLIDFLDGKIGNNIEQGLYEAYQNSNFRNETLKVILDDNSFTQPYLQCILQKVKLFFKGKNISQQYILSFLNILDDDLTETKNKDFQTIFSCIIDQLLKDVKGQTINLQVKMRREFLTTINNMFICQDLPKRLLNNQKNPYFFHEFYQKLQNETLDDLQKSVMLQYSKFLD